MPNVIGYGITESGRDGELYLAVARTQRFGDAGTKALKLPSGRHSEAVAVTGSYPA
jgi:hypothetical protein